MTVARMTKLLILLFVLTAIAVLVQGCGGERRGPGPRRDEGGGGNGRREDGGGGNRRRNDGGGGTERRNDRRVGGDGQEGYPDGDGVGNTVGRNPDSENTNNQGINLQNRERLSSRRSSSGERRNGQRSRMSGEIENFGQTDQDSRSRNTERRMSTFGRRNLGGLNDESSLY